MTKEGYKCVYDFYDNWDIANLAEHESLETSLLRIDHIDTNLQFNATEALTPNVFTVLRSWKVDMSHSKRGDHVNKWGIESTRSLAQYRDFGEQKKRKSFRFQNSLMCVL